MIKLISLLFVLIFSVSMALSQEHYLVELENRTPDVKSMVMAYEGSNSIPFLAKDVNGVEQSLLSKTGKTVILWFWHQDCQNCLKQIDALNLLVTTYSKDLEVVSFSNNTKEEVLAFQQGTPMSFPVIPNSETLAEGPYGGDLGFPKFFILDKNAKIKWAIPESEMRGDFNTYNFLETLHVSLGK